MKKKKTTTVFKNQKEKTILYHLIYGVFWFLGCLHGLVSKIVSFMLGRFVYYCVPKYRHIVQDNLEIAFGEEKDIFERTYIAKKVFVNLILLLFEIGWSLHLTDEKVSQYFEATGIEHIKKALEKKKGVFFLTGHIGNWELLAPVSHLLGTVTNVLYRPLDFAPLDLFFVKSRSRNGGNLISNRGGLRKIIGHIRKNEAGLILLDQNAAWHEGVFVDFFGKRACTAKGLSVIARRLQTPVIPIFLIRKGNGFLMEVLPEVEQVFTDDETKDFEENTQRYNNIIEGVIRKYPDQWFWVHRRWKTLPYHSWPRKENR